MQFFTLLVFVGAMIQLAMSQAPTPAPTRTPTRTPTRFPTKNKIKYVTTVSDNLSYSLLCQDRPFTHLDSSPQSRQPLSDTTVGKGTHRKRCSVCCDWNARFYCDVLHHIFEEEAGFYLGSSKGIHQK